MTHRLVILITGLVLFAVSHSIFAAGGMRARLEAALGGRPRTYRLLYNILSISLLAGTLAWAWGEYPVLWRAQGAAYLLLRLVQVAAIVGYATTLLTFDLRQFLWLGRRTPPSLSGQVPPSAPRLRTTGAYALCRHPLYLFTCLVFSATPTMHLGMLVFAAWLWLYSYVGSHFEEHRLLLKFGEPYRRYRALRPRLLPLPLPGRRRRALAVTAVSAVSRLEKVS